MPEIPPSHRRQFSGTPAAPAGGVDLLLRRTALQNEFFLSRRSLASRRTGGPGGRLGLSGAGHYRPQHAGRSGAGARRRQTVRFAAGDRRRNHARRCTSRRLVDHRSGILRPAVAVDHFGSAAGSQRRVSGFAGRRGGPLPQACWPASSVRPANWSISIRSHAIANASATAATCWPNCFSMATTTGGSTVWPSGRARPICRWWPPATSTITRPIARPWPTCWRPSGRAKPSSARGAGCFPMPSVICNRSRRWPRGFRGSRRRWPAARPSPGVRPFRSTNCVTNIPKSWRRRAKLRWPI